MKILSSLLLTCLCLSALSQPPDPTRKPVRMGIVGLVHDHVHGILGRAKTSDLEIVGIAEPNRALAETYAKRYGFSMNIVFNTIEEMVEKTKPEAVLAYTSIYDHLKAVEYCAPRGIHVMVEKPMAVSDEHAQKMLAIAKKYHIHLLTNFETTWYGSNREAWMRINDQQQIGEIRKIIFHTGHPGPVEIGVSPQFLAWLTDPVLNGDGALTDFGCYGANLATWLTKGQVPLTVTAVTRQFKPEEYPKVDDEATIILDYAKAQVIIEASWNWPVGRKDMEVYGTTGQLFCLDGRNMSYQKDQSSPKQLLEAPPMPMGSRDPFEFFARVIRGDTVMDTYDLSAPANNGIVVRILDAAKESAKTGKTVRLR